MSTVVHVNVQGYLDLDDQAVASLLRDVKMIAEKEVELDQTTSLEHRSLQTRCNASPVIRGRSISFATEEVTTISTSPPLSPVPFPTMKQPKSISSNLLDHHDWSSHAGSCSQQLQVKKKIKRKDESFVGQIPKAKIRATLRRKFSWKQYPELEAFLLTSQREYFDYSKRNYTPEQRRFNNKLTKSVLELASNQGYAFEGFTFAMVRDRIRCYFKSYVQSAKKRGSLTGYAPGQRANIQKGSADKNIVESHR